MAAESASNSAVRTAANINVRPAGRIRSSFCMWIPNRRALSNRFPIRETASQPGSDPCPSATDHFRSIVS